MPPAISTNAAGSHAVFQPNRLASAIKRAPRQDESPESSRFATADELSISSDASPQGVRPTSKLAMEEADKKEPAEGELTEEQEEQVEELKDRDREVRTHEQAHLAAAGPYALGGPTYQFEKGPDGQNYAIGGEVQIDTAPVDGDPEATIQKARIVRAAALAPAEPSSQDRAVAAQATQTEQQAQAELQTQRRQETSSEEEPGDEQDPQSSAATYPATSKPNRTASKLIQLIARNSVDSKALNLNLLA